MAANARKITATYRNGETVSTTGLGAKRVVGAIRVTEFPNGDLLVTVHKDLPTAVKSPNQTPVWNPFPRWAIAVTADDQVTGEWVPASK